MKSLMDVLGTAVAKGAESRVSWNPVCSRTGHTRQCVSPKSYIAVSRQTLDGSHPVCMAHRVNWRAA
jgi:hypothetical protein